jgi:hypothetical protein
MRVYADDQPVFDQDYPPEGFINPTLSLPAGPHRIVIVAWNNAGAATFHQPAILLSSEMPVVQSPPLWKFLTRLGMQILVQASISPALCSTKAVAQRTGHPQCRSD